MSGFCGEEIAMIKTVAANNTNSGPKTGTGFSGVIVGLLIPLDFPGKISREGPVAYFYVS